MRYRLFSLVLLIPATVRAQATITGVVRDSLKRPINDVEVTIASTERRVRTDSAGQFTFSALDAGSYNLRARRIGYFPATTKVAVAAKATKSIVIEIEKRPIMLDTVQVTASCARFQFAGFACRRRNAGNANAFFFDVDAIDSANPRFPIDMMRGIPGIRVVAVRGGRGLGLESTRDWMCKFALLANGKPPSLANPLPEWPSQAIGIEVYPTGKDIPPEYSQYGGIRHANTCGLVNYWTVVRPRRR